MGSNLEHGSIFFTARALFEQGRAEREKAEQSGSLPLTVFIVVEICWYSFGVTFQGLTSSSTPFSVLDYVWASTTVGLLAH